MDKKQIRKEIATLINSIKEHSDTIGDKEHIPQLELELILHKIEKLYQKSIVYNHLNSEEKPEERKPLTGVVTAPPAAEPSKTLLPEPELPKTEVPVTLVPETEPPVSEPSKKMPVPDEIKPEEPKKEIPAAEIKPEVKTPELKPVDLFGAELPPAAEKPKEKKSEKKEDKSVHKLQLLPLSDLRNGIGINDKFQYSNELFGGEMKEYEIAVQQLNTSETLESATAYFNSLQQLYNWDPESETVQRLQKLVQRRYS